MEHDEHQEKAQKRFGIATIGNPIERPLTKGDVVLLIVMLIIISFGIWTVF